MPRDLLAMSARLWAPIVTPTRGKPWVVWTAVRMTRRDAKDAYLEGQDPEHRAKALKRVRFARVTITEDVPNG